MLFSYLFSFFLKLGLKWVKASLEELEASEMELIDEFVLKEDTNVKFERKYVHVSKDSYMPPKKQSNLMKSLSNLFGSNNNKNDTQMKNNNDQTYETNNESSN